MLPQSDPDGDPWGPKVTKILPNLEPKADKNEAKPKSRENRSDERSKNDLWGGCGLTFGVPFGSILAPKTGQRGHQKASKNSVNF